MEKYQTYATSIKVYYSLGLQNQFVAKEVRSQIPGSTIAAWKQRSFKHIVGLDLEKNIQNNLNEIQLLYHAHGKIPRKIATAQIRLIMFIISCFDKTVFQKAIRTNKLELIHFMDRFQKEISYKQMSKVLGLSLKTLHHWKTQIKFRCDHSALLFCVKRNPNQATIPEVKTIKDWLSKTEYQHWGIHTIWAKAFKEKRTNLSLKSWYHYNQLLKIRLCVRKGKKPKRISLRANSVNQIWHADITVFKTLDGMKHYIYTVMDNYSRFIHSWHIDTVVSATIRLQTIRDALQNAFGNVPIEKLQLVTDGGPENDNLTIKEFIQTSTINHTIALRDIKQSNSMMEAFYRTSKYQYLYLRHIANGNQLKKEFQNWMNEYNFEKPHYGLGIYTPAEMINGADPFTSFRSSFLEAAKRRREINKNNHCTLKCD